MNVIAWICSTEEKVEQQHKKTQNVRDHQRQIELVIYGVPNLLSSFRINTTDKATTHIAFKKKTENKNKWWHIIVHMVIVVVVCKLVVYVNMDD